MKELKSWLVYFDFARSLDEAERLCERGSIRVDGSVVSNSNFIPPIGSCVGSLENPYTFCIPEPEYSMEV